MHTIAAAAPAPEANASLGIPPRPVWSCPVQAVDILARAAMAMSREAVERAAFVVGRETLMAGHDGPTRLAGFCRLVDVPAD